MRARCPFTRADREFVIARFSALYSRVATWEDAFVAGHFLGRSVPAVGAGYGPFT